MSFHGFFILMGQTYLAWCQDKWSFEAHVSYLRDAFDGVTKVIQFAEVKLGSGDLSTGKRTQRRVLLKNMPQCCHSSCMIGAAGELDYFSAHIRLREPGKSEDKAEKGRKCKATDSRAMGLAAPWYRKGGTYVESSTPYSHGGRALVVKGAEEVENAEVNSKYQDKAEGQRPRNFIRPVLMGFSSNSRKWGELVKSMGVICTTTFRLSIFSLLPAFASPLSLSFASSTATTPKPKPAVPCQQRSSGRSPSLRSLPTSKVDAHPYFPTLLRAALAAHQLPPPPPPFYGVLAGNVSGGMSRGGEARKPIEVKFVAN
ncbi:hypothetical protein BHE74_00021006 [Ensete ventricosum]|nr:hypothetical protein BHE74_00021006 [Ensete ventricosum]